MPIWGRKIKGEKSHKNRFGEGLGLHFGGVWGDLGRLLGALGRLLAILGAFKIELFFNIGPRWSPRGLLDRFGVLLGGSWASFFALGRFLGASWTLLGEIFPCWGSFSNWTPALIRSASKSSLS